MYHTVRPKRGLLALASRRPQKRSRPRPLAHALGPRQKTIPVIQAGLRRAAAARGGEPGAETKRAIVFSEGIPVIQVLVYRRPRPVSDGWTRAVVSSER